jgi:flagellar protein FliO/FliZ
MAQLIWAITCIVVILGLAYWVTRYIAQRGRGGGLERVRKEGDLSVLSRMTLGKDQQLAVVKVADHYYLLGVTSSQITMLAELPPEEAASWQTDHDTPPADPLSSFGKTLKTVLQQKIQR